MNEAKRSPITIIKNNLGDAEIYKRACVPIFLFNEQVINVQFRYDYTIQRSIKSIISLHAKYFLLSFTKYNQGMNLKKNKYYQAF